jgi:hypothetical protein
MWYGIKQSTKADSKVKAKVNFFLSLIKHSDMTYWEVQVWIHAFVTSALGGGEWSYSHLRRFNTGVTTPNAHWIGGWVGNS